MEQALKEHASQFNEAVSALIIAMGMQAENEKCRFEGKPPIYNVDDFVKVVSDSDLSYNALISKQHRFN